MYYIKSILKGSFLFASLFVFSLSSEGQTVLEPSSYQKLVEAAESKGILIADIDDYVITDHYTSRGVTHTYLNQSYRGVPILDQTFAMHSKINFNYSTFNIIKNLDEYVVDESKNMDILSALNKLSEIKGYTNDQRYEVIEDKGGIREQKKVENSSFSLSPISTELVYYVKDKSELALAYKVGLEQTEDAFFKLYYIDANSGSIVKEMDLTITCDFGEHPHKHSAGECSTSFRAATMGLDSSYNVIAFPLESPHQGGRSIEVKPWELNTAASPNGWHNFNGTDFTHSRGNNVDAYEDTNSSNGPTGGDDARADGGANLDFDFPWTPTGPVADYQDAAVTNLFYWNNIIHDLLYNYGFDEASGNFQEENFTANGNGSDYVRAEAQDGAGTCNANFGTPSDGGNPRMQMFVCSNSSVSRDGDFDNLVIVHEYGHGVSNRLTGGPGASGCLGNSEQMGEGWSDYLGVVMTLQAGDDGANAQPVGNWLFRQGPNGNGIRPFPYSTDMAINPSTYDDIKSFSVPHGVGSVWATMLWDMTWALIDEYGFDADAYNGTAGNNIALALVMEGMKLQPCSPGFVDGRDAILAADQALYGGMNECLIWKAFAQRGLGVNASQGSTGSRSDGSENFELPASCSYEVEQIASSTVVPKGGQVDYTVKVVNTRAIDLNNVIVSSTIPDSLSVVTISNGGLVSNDSVKWTNVNIVSGDSIEYTYTLMVPTNSSFGEIDIIDDVENGNQFWNVTNSGSTSFVIQSTTVNSGTGAWFADDASSSGVAQLDLAVEVGGLANSTLTFTHLYDTEATWDGGRVFISEDLGTTWEDADGLFTQNGYNSRIFNDTDIPAFSGNSGGFITSIIDLSSYDDKVVLIRFQMDCDQFVGGNGWYIDDIELEEVHRAFSSIATVDEGACKEVEVATGHVRIIGDGISLSYVTTPVSCGQTSDGAIDLTVNGNSTAPIMYNWSNGATSEDLSNIPGGIYGVTVTDGAGLVESAQIQVLTGTQSMVTDKLDNGGTENIRYFVETNYCPNDTIFFHPSLLGDTILISNPLNLMGNLAVMGLGQNSLTIDAKESGMIFLVRPTYVFDLNDIKLINALGEIGPIRNSGFTILNNVTLEKNRTPTSTISLINEGEVEIRGTTIMKE